MDKLNYLFVSEIFYSIQGEGISSGIPSVFVRLSGCNLMCGGHGTEKDKKLHNGATWRCDTIEVWRKGNKMLFKDIAREWIQQLCEGAHLIITGGEPMLQQKGIVCFLKWWKKEYKFKPFVEIETNGTIMPNNDMIRIVNQWNCSPKLSNSGMHIYARIKFDVLKVLSNTNKVQFKFVISNEVDWDEIYNTYLFVGYILKEQVVLMPAASNLEELLINNVLVAALCIEHNLRFSSRLQIEIWNKTVGV